MEIEQFMTQTDVSCMWVLNVRISSAKPSSAEVLRLTCAFRISKLCA